MAKEYNIGDRLYLPVWITEKETNVMMGPDKSTTTTDAKFSYAYWHGKTGEGKVRYGDPGLLLTTEEVAEEYNDMLAVRIQLLEKENEMYRKTICNRDKEIAGLEAERDDLKGAAEELKARNAELEALLKEVMATRDEAIKQNDELITENKKLKAENGAWQVAAQTCADNAKVADKATEELRKENKDLKAKVAENADTISRLSANKVALTEEVARLRETIADRTIDVQHLTEENEKLKAEIGRTTAYYMEANRTASEAAEANDDLKAKIADLRNRVGEQLAQIQDLNAEVHFLKESGKQKPTEEATKHAHVVLNDGTELAFTQKDTQAFYRDDVDMLFISDGDGVIAGFNRGDKPTNFAYFY